MMAGIGAAMAAPQSRAPASSPVAAPAGAGVGGAGGERAGDGGDQPNVTPEEQAAYDQFVINGRQLIYDPKSPEKVNAAILASLTATGDPVQDLAVTAASVVTGLIENAANAGHRLDPDIAYHGGVELLEDLGDIAEAAGIHRFTDRETEAAMYRAMDIVLKNDPGSIVDQAGAERQFGEVVSADRDGTLDQAMPALGKAIARGARSGAA